MKREQIIKAIIDSLGLLEDTEGHGYKLHIYKGEWWISHNVVGSGEPVRQWIERELENAQLKQAASETHIIDEMDNSPYEIVFNGRTYIRK